MKYFRFSANNNEVGKLILIHNSIIKVMKNKGPKVEPCYTPESMGGGPELAFMFSCISADYVQ